MAACSSPLNYPCAFQRTRSIVLTPSRSTFAKFSLWPRSYLLSISVTAWTRLPSGGLMVRRLNLMRHRMLFTRCTSRCPQTSSWTQSLKYPTMEPRLPFQPRHPPRYTHLPFYLPPEDFFGEPITEAAYIWTLGVSLYEVLGERALFETFGWGRDDIMADMVNTLGLSPTRWWDKWEDRKEFFEPDGSWVCNMKRVYTPAFRPLHQRIWDMGHGRDA